MHDLPCGLEQPNGFALAHSKKGRVELTFEDDEPAGKQWREALDASLAALRGLRQRQLEHGSSPPSSVGSASPPKSSGVSSPALSRAATLLPGQRPLSVSLERRASASSISGGGAAKEWRRGTMGGPAGAEASARTKSATDLMQMRAQLSKEGSKGQQEEENDDDEDQEDDQEEEATPRLERKPMTEKSPRTQKKVAKPLPKPPTIDDEEMIW